MISTVIGGTLTVICGGIAVYTALGYVIPGIVITVVSATLCGILGFATVTYWLSNNIKKE